MSRILVAVAAAAAVMAAGTAAAQKPASASARTWIVPGRPEIRKILVERIDKLHQARAMVVGVVDASGRQVVSYGNRDNGDNRSLDSRSIFAIGAMSQVFTSLILVRMADLREASLDEPVGKYLPDGSKVPGRGGKQITLIDLATDSSGLPRLPTNFAPKDPANPYADYSADQLLKFLAGYSLPRDIGSSYEDSDLSAGLLGYALSRRAGTNYEALLDRRIAVPDHMTSTTVTLTPDQKARLETGHDGALHPVAAWDFQDVMVGAGGLYSDMDDLLGFLEQEFGLHWISEPVGMDTQAQLKPRRPTDSPDTEIAMGWRVTTTPQGPIVWTGDDAGGYSSVMAVDLKAKVAVVVLADAETPVGLDELAFHILTGSPLAQPPAAAAK